MRKSVRRVMLFAAVVIFFAVSPLIILYAIGYRLSAVTAQSDAIGVVLVDAEPGRANVFLNDRYLGRVPEAATAAPDTEVLVRVEREGYGTWQKQLSTLPGRAVEVRDVRLFPSSITENRIAQSVLQFSVAPDRTRIALISGTVARPQFELLDDTGTLTPEPIPLAAVPQRMLWSADSSQVLLHAGIRPLIVTADGTTQATPVRLPPNAVDVVWDPRINNRLLYQVGDQIAALDVTTGGVAVLAEDVRAFSVSTRTIWVIGRDNTLTRLTLSGEVEQTGALPGDEPITALHVTPAGTVAYHAADNGVWIHEIMKSPVYVGMAQRVNWSPSGDLLLLTQDDHSMHVYNVSDERVPMALGTLTLITRLSRSVIDPQWFAGGRHIVYQVDDELHIQEIDTRDRPVDVQITTTNVGRSQVAVGRDGDTLLYLKKTNNRVDLVEAELLTLEDQ